MSVRLTALSALLTLLPAAAVRAESLREAWAVADDAHRLIAAAREQGEAAALELESAKSGRYPEVALSSAYTRFDQAPSFAFDGFVSPPLFDDDSFAMASAGVRVPLYTGGAVSHGIAAAQSAADASESHIAAVEQSVRLAVAAAFIDILRAESALAVAASNVATLESHAADARSRYESGAVPRNDLLAASVELADANQRRLQAENTLALAWAAYNRLLGRPLDAPVALDAELELGSLLPDGDDFEALLAIARERRPELGAATAEARALQEQSAAEKAASRPQLALTGGYQFLENQVLDEDAFWTVGVGFEWKLFDKGRTGSRAGALERRANAMLHERADLETRIALEIRQAMLDAGEAADRRGVAEQALEQAAENLAVVRDRYVSGAGTSSEVLDAESLRTQSIDNLDNARFDYEFARLRLARAIGSLQ